MLLGRVIISVVVRVTLVVGAWDEGVGHGTGVALLVRLLRHGWTAFFGEAGIDVFVEVVGLARGARVLMRLGYEGVVVGDGCCALIA